MIRSVETSSWRGLLAVCLAAAAVRAAFAVQFANSPLWGVYTLDTLYYRSWALRIAGGDWVGSGVFEQGPLYAYLLAVVYSLAGAAELPVLLFQMACGVATAALVFDITRRLNGTGAALAAGGLAAVYGPLLLHECLTMKTFLEPLLVLLALWLLLRGDRESAAGGMRHAVLAGAALGAAVLVREVHILLLLPAAAFLITRAAGEGRGRRGRLLLALGFGCAAAILPAAARNLALAGEFTPVSSAGGENIYIAFGPEATGSYRAPAFVRPLPHTEHEDFREEARLRTRTLLTRAECSSFWYREGLRFVRDNPGRTLKILARKIVLLFNDFEIPDNDNYRASRGLLPLLRVVPTFGWIFGLGLLGLACAPRLGRRGWLLGGFVGMLVLEVLLTFNLARYRLALTALWLIGAGAGGAWLFEQARAGGHGVRRALIGAGIAAIASAAAFIPLADLERGRRELESQYRTEFERLARQRSALPGLAAAARALPRDAARTFDFGFGLEGSGFIPEAERAFAEVLRIDPANLAARKELARLADRLGRPAEAAAHLRTMVSLAPGDAWVRFALGSVLARLAAESPAAADALTREARVNLEEAARLDPALTGAWYQLGRLSWLADDDATAQRELQHALETDPGNEAVIRLLERISLGPAPL